MLAPTSHMQERYIKWWTPCLNREFGMLVFGNGSALPLILFPTSFGRYSQNKDPWKFNHMNIILGIGEWDNTRHESMRLAGILHSKGIPHWLDDRKWCGHDWNYWREMLPYYLQSSNKS